jgi:hypothetical protein
MQLNSNSSMQSPSSYSRKLLAGASCAIFLVIAKLYEWLSQATIDGWRVLCWSAIGVVSYIVLCRVFGFDPHRTRLARHAPALWHYVDRWELRQGQAILCMLGMLVIGARLLDAGHFVTAVVSGTLAAWTYFTLRLFTRSYEMQSS